MQKLSLIILVLSCVFLFSGELSGRDVQRSSNSFFKEQTSTVAEDRGGLYSGNDKHFFLQGGDGLRFALDQNGQGNGGGLGDYDESLPVDGSLFSTLSLFLMMYGGFLYYRKSLKRK